MSWGFQDLIESDFEFCIVFCISKWNSSYFSNKHFQVEHKQTDQFMRVHILPKRLYSSGTGTDLSRCRDLANYDVGIPIFVFSQQP